MVIPKAGESLRLLAYGVVAVLVIGCGWHFLDRPFQDPVEFTFMEQEVVEVLQERSESGTFLVLPDKIAEWSDRNRLVDPSAAGPNW